MSEENVETVRRAVAAVNARDIDRYLACCTEDVELRTPLVPIGGIYEGPDDIRRFFADIRTQRRTFGSTSIEWRQSARTEFWPSCASPRADEQPAFPPRLPPQTSTTSSMARSGASESSSTAKRPSKQPLCRSRRCRRNVEIV